MELTDNQILLLILLPQAIIFLRLAQLIPAAGKTNAVLKWYAENNPDYIKGDGVVLNEDDMLALIRDYHMAFRPRNWFGFKWWFHAYPLNEAGKLQ